MTLRWFSCFGFSLLLSVGAQAQVFQTSAGDVVAEVIADELVHPWALGFLPDGRFLVTERPGRLRVVDADGTLGAPISGLPAIADGGQGGLLDVAVSEDFATSGLIFFAFSEPSPDGRGRGTALMSARLELDGDSGRLVDQDVIFRMNKYTNTGLHFGSRIVIASDGTLFVTLGERGDMDRAQDPFDLAGGVIRINPDGTIPADNPFADGVDGAPEFWSIGHRNPQGATLGPQGDLWTVEHGAQGGDEINKPLPGRNYGWPVITYGENYGGGRIGVGTSAPGYEQPAYYWDPSIAPSGMDLYDGAVFPDWQGDLLVGALKFQLLVRLDMQDGEIVGEERLFEGAFGRIRDVRTGPEGAIYMITDAQNGKIIRVTPAQ